MWFTPNCKRGSQTRWRGRERLTEWQGPPILVCVCARVWRMGSGEQCNLQRKTEELSEVWISPQNLVACEPSSPEDSIWCSRSTAAGLNNLSSIFLTVSPKTPLTCVVYHRPTAPLAALRTPSEFSALGPTITVWVTAVYSSKYLSESYPLFKAIITFSDASLLWSPQPDQFQHICYVYSLKKVGGGFLPSSQLYCKIPEEKSHSLYFLDSS